MLVRLGLITACALVCLAGCQTTSEEVPDTIIGSEASNPPATDEPARNGRAQFASGNYGLAERQFRDAVEKNPEDGASWLGLAAAYDNLKRFDLADRAYAQAVRIQGNTLEILNNRGYSYLLRGQGRQAVAEFRRALELDPENPVILNNLRLLRLGQGQARATRF